MSINNFAVPNSTYDFGATLFFQDPTTGDRVAVNFEDLGAPPITWSLVDSATGNPIPTSQAGFIAFKPNTLVLTPALTTPRVTVRATVGNVVGAAPILINEAVP